MIYSKLIVRGAQLFLVFSAIALFFVSAMALLNPQAVMDLVNVKLTNNDAISSIRGVYGGVGFTICISLTYLLVKQLDKALLFLSLLWGSYAMSRFLTVLNEGALGDFGKQWIIIESILFLFGLVFYCLHQHLVKTTQFKSYGV